MTPITSILTISNRASKHKRQGAMLVLICVMIFAFIATVALGVDIAYMHLVRAELRSATDAAAKGTSSVLARTQDRAAAIAQGKQIALQNNVAGKGLELADSDFLFGHASQDNTGRFVFQEGKTPINSVQVTGSRKSTSLSGSVGLFFGRILGRTTFEPVENASATFLERDIVLVVDRSGSMAGQKFVDLRNSVRTFVTTLQANPVEENVGLASYSTASTEDVQMTKDLPRLNTAMNRMRVDGFTNTSAGIASGSRVLNRGRSGDFVERTMIVMTDGLSNVGRNPEIDAQLIAAEGVTIYTISFGFDADQNGMKRIADIGKGKHFHANNGAQLREVFREIANTLSTIITE